MTEPTSLEKVNTRRLVQHLEAEFSRVLREGNVFGSFPSQDQCAQLNAQMQGYLDHLKSDKVKVVQDAKITSRGYIEEWRQLKDGSIVVRWTNYGNETLTAFRRKPRRTSRVIAKRQLMGKMGFDTAVRPAAPAEYISITLEVKRDTCTTPEPPEDQGLDAAVEEGFREAFGYDENGDKPDAN